MATRNGFHHPPSSTLDSQSTVLRRATPARARATAPPVALHKVSQRQRLFRLRPCSLFPGQRFGRAETRRRCGRGGAGLGPAASTVMRLLSQMSMPSPVRQPSGQSQAPSRGRSSILCLGMKRKRAAARRSGPCHQPILPFFPLLPTLSLIGCRGRRRRSLCSLPRCAGPGAPATPTTTRPRAILNVSKPASVPSTWSLTTPGMHGIVALQQTHHLHGPPLHRLILAAVKSGCPRNGDRSQR